MNHLCINTHRYLLYLLILLLPYQAQAGGDSEIAIIVAPDNSWNGLQKPINRRQLARIFRKQIIFDREGRRLHPINLSASHPLRKVFSRSLFKRTPQQMASFWNEKYFQGISPPHTIDSQEAMIRFVSSTPGAIGYVAACATDKRVKILLTLKIKGKPAPSLCQ
jgi:ABC-type phosphate transport system substrate-binding protein